MNLVIKMFDNYSLGNRVTALRQMAGFSQEKLAELAELSTEYVSQIERGMKSPTVRSIQKICNAVGVELSDFFAESFEYSDILDAQIKAKLKSKTSAEKAIILKQIELFEQYKSIE